MKIAMSSLDIMACAEELKIAVGARVDKVYELDGLFILRLRSPGKGRLDLLIEPGRRVHLTTMEYKSSRQPTAYAMFLRKHLANARLAGISQPKFERILEFRFRGREERVLIAELFGSGNLILCDEDLVIIQPYRVEVWRHRALKPGEKYLLPPMGLDIRELDRVKLRDALVEAPDIVRGLAVNLNLGGPLAEEVCARAGVQKDRKPAELSEMELQSLVEAVAALFDQKLAPHIVCDDDRPIDVIPFDFASYLGKRVKRFESFNQALDEYFGALAVQSTAARQRGRLELRAGRLRRRLAEQEARLAELEAKARDAKGQADLIATHHVQVEEALHRLAELRRAKGWQATIGVLQRARESGETWAKLIKTVDVRAVVAEMELEGKAVAVDLRLPAFGNASKLYRRYKKLAEKAEGARKAVAKTELELNETLSAGMAEVAAPALRKRRKPRWFERFRWFISSDGILVIGGRDAATNREVVEKHMQPGDRYLHADIVGAPHVVVKADGKEVPETTMREAAEFAAMHSRAWREGLGALDVYWVLPEQVSRQAPSGEYLPRGSYAIKGKRNFLKVPVRAAIGVVALDDEQVVVCGPPSAVGRHSKVVIQIVPGQLKKSDLAKKMQVGLRTKGVDVSIDELMRALPPGMGEIRGLG